MINEPIDSMVGRPLVDPDSPQGASEIPQGASDRSPGPTRPRIRYALLAPLVGVLGNISLTAVFTVIAFALVNQGVEDLGREESFARIFQHPLGMAAIILPGQIAFLLAGLIPAIRSPEPTAERLDLRPARLPKWTWLAFALASPLTAVPVSIVYTVLDLEPSGQLKMIGEMLSKQSGFSLLLTGFLISVLPGVVEELLFRGYVQSRLLKRWSPAVAIGVSALLFAAAHLDPMHALGVFPLGIWFGLIAWKCGSVYPAMLAHFVNNLIAFLGAQFANPETAEPGPFHFGLGAVVITAMIVSVFVLFRKPDTLPPPELASDSTPVITESESETA